MSPGKASVWLALVVAFAAAVVPWQVCIATESGAAVAGFLGHHGHHGHGGHGAPAGAPDDPVCPCGECPQRPSCPSGGEDHCCVHAPMDVGVLWVATALDLPAYAGRVAPLLPAPTAARVRGEPEARVPCEEDSVVLVR
jgi:hypothetical protein